MVSIGRLFDSKEKAHHRLAETASPTEFSGLK